jgi:hypothetical protein
MRAEIEFKRPPNPAPKRLAPRPQRRAAAVVAQYIQDLVRAQGRAGARPCSEAV